MKNEFRMELSQDEILFYVLRNKALRLYNIRLRDTKFYGNHPECMRNKLTVVDQLSRIQFRDNIDNSIHRKSSNLHVGDESQLGQLQNGQPHFHSVNDGSNCVHNHYRNNDNGDYGHACDNEVCDSDACDDVCMHKNPDNAYCASYDGMFSHLCDDVTYAFCIFFDDDYFACDLLNNTHSYCIYPCGCILANDLIYYALRNESCHLDEIYAEQIHLMKKSQLLKPILYWQATYII